MNQGEDTLKLNNVPMIWRVLDLGFVGRYVRARLLGVGAPIYTDLRTAITTAASFGNFFPVVILGLGGSSFSPGLRYTATPEELRLSCGRLRPMSAPAGLRDTISVFYSMVVSPTSPIPTSRCSIRYSLDGR